MPKEINSIRYTINNPTTIITHGANDLGFELAKSLSEQNGYVIIIDDLKGEDYSRFLQLKHVYMLDIAKTANLVNDLRRLDYVFYFNHQNAHKDERISSHDYLANINYLQEIIRLAQSFDAGFVLTNPANLYKQQIAKAKLDRLANQDTFYRRSDLLRHLENVVLETNNDKAVEYKVLRMGDIIGSYYLYQPHSILSKLLINGITGNHLYLKGDGLDSNYYVELDDAVYGLLKAQFTPVPVELKRSEEPAGLFTLAYEQPVTQLSLAYKVQELERQAGEIRFIDDEVDTHQALGSHQAAPNLTALGWKPRTSFEQGLLASISSLKQALLSQGWDPADWDLDSNAISQIVADLESANQVNDQALPSKYSHAVEQTKTRPKKSLFAEVQQQVDGLKANVAFLRRLTLWEAGLYILLFAAFAFIFFNFISPTAHFATEFLLAQRQMTEIDQALLERDSQRLNAASEAYNWHVENMSTAIDSGNLAFDALNMERLERTMQTYTSASEYAAEAIDNYAQATLSATELYQSQNIDLVYRPTNTSVLSVNEGAGESSEITYAQVEAQYAAAERAIQNYARLENQIDQSPLPGQLDMSLRGFLDQNTQALNTIQTRESNFELLQLLSQDNFELGFVILDSHRPNFSGGKPVTIGYLQYNQGKLQQIALVDINDLSIPELQAEPEFAELEKVLTSAGEELQGLNALTALDYAPTIDMQEQILSLLYAQTFETTTDEIMLLSATAFEDILAGQGPVELNGTSFEAGNYFQIISDLQEGSSRRRAEYLTGLSAVVFARLFDPDLTDFTNMSTLLSGLHENGKATSVNGKIFPQRSETQDLLLEVYVKSEENEVARVIPAVELLELVNIREDSTINSLQLELAGVPNLSEAMICLAGADNVSTDLDAIDYTNLTILDKPCLYIEPRNTTSIEVNYQVPFTNSLYHSKIKAQLGLIAKADLSFEISSSGLELAEAEPDINQNDQNYFYFDEFFGEYVYKLSFN